MLFFFLCEKIYALELTVNVLKFRTLYSMFFLFKFYFFYAAVP